MEWNNQLVFGGQGMQPMAAFTFSCIIMILWNRIDSWLLSKHI